MLTHLRDWREAFLGWIHLHPAAAVALFTSILTALLLGILQELTNRLIDTEIAPWLGVAQAFPRWTEILVAILAFLAVYVGYQRSLENTRLRATLGEDAPAAIHKRMKDAEWQRALFGAYLNTSLEVLETLGVYLAQMSWEGGDPDQAKKLLIQLILKRIQRMYSVGVIPSVSVYTPSKTDLGCLTIFDCAPQNPERVARAKWYIGPDRTRQRSEGGTAGLAYVKKKVYVRHISERSHRAEEGSDYIPSRKAGDVAVYLSFVAMPILDGTSCVGVLCVDSSVRDTFDGDPEQAELAPAARLLAQVIKLQKLPSSLA